MKKAFKSLCGIMCLLTVLALLFTGCDQMFGQPVEIPKSHDNTPIYYGMLMSISPDVEIPEVTYADDPIKNNGNHNGHGNTDNNGNHYGWYKDDNGDGKLDTDFLKQLCYVSPNQDVYFYVGISNPAKYEIVSFVLNGQTYTSDMFEARSTNEVKIVKGNIGNASGIVEYTISDIKYSDGTDNKDVMVVGNRTTKAGVKVDDQVTATVNNIQVDGNKASFDITLFDKDGLIAYSNGSAKIVLYQGDEIIDEKKLSVGSNEVKFNNLKGNNPYYYSILAFYDDLSGAAAAYHELIGKTPLQAGHDHSFGEWTITKAATCGEDGVKERVCSSCGEKETEKIPATEQHTVVIDKAVEATCSATGLTEGKHCGACQKVLLAQTQTEKKPHAYDDQYDATCNRCGSVREVECAHKNVISLPGKEANCTQTGLTKGEKCADCGEIIVEQTIIPATGIHFYTNWCDTTCNMCGAVRVTPGHIYDDQYDATCNECGFVREVECAHTNTVKIPAIEATCTSDGLTEGKKCADCGEIIIEQKVIRGGHLFQSDCDINCEVCEYVRFAPSDHTYDDQYDATCNACGFVREVECAHNYERTITTSNNYATALVTYTCSGCGDSYSETITPTDFTVTADNRAMVGYTGEMYENLVIPAVFEDNGTWYRVTSIGGSAFGFCNLLSVVIPEGVTSIGEWAFDYNFYLTNIQIPDSVTTIGRSAFEHCFEITSISISKNVTSIGESAFSGSGKLTSITVDKENPAYYVDGNCLIERASKALLKGCNNSVIPSYVTRICDGAFYFCKELTSVTIPNTVTHIGSQAFQECDKLTSITIPESVTSIDWQAFCYCNAIAYIYYEGSENEWNNITVDINNDELLNATRYYYSETQPTTEGNYWHYVDGVPTVWETSIAPGYSIGLAYTSNGDGTCYVSGIGTCSDTNLIIPAVSPDGETVTGIGHGAFAGSNLLSVVIPEGVTNIDADAFLSCLNLSSIVIPDSVRSIGNFAFNDCYYLTSITLPNNLTSIGEYAFKFCSNLTSLEIPNSVTSIGCEAFSNCRSLVDITFEANSSLTKIEDGTFSGCTSLVNITIPDSITTIGWKALYGCEKLSSVKISNSVTSIGDNTFQYCTSLESIVIPDSVTNIGESAFGNCDALTSVTIGNGIISIGGSAFINCDALTSIEIPNSITRIGDSMFYRCSSLTSITFDGTVEQWKAIALGYRWNYECPATEVICSDGVVPLN